MTTEDYKAEIKIAIQEHVIAPYGKLAIYQGYTSSGVQQMTIEALRELATIIEEIMEEQKQKEAK